MMNGSEPPRNGIIVTNNDNNAKECINYITTIVNIHIAHCKSSAKRSWLLARQTTSLPTRQTPSHITRTRGYYQSANPAPKNTLGKNGVGPILAQPSHLSTRFSRDCFWGA